MNTRKFTGDMASQVEKDRDELIELRAKCERLEAQAKDDKEYIESLCKELCTMEDALGFKHDCHDKDGAWVPTIGQWLERVRDLIASEGERGDILARLEEAQRLLVEPVDSWGWGRWEKAGWIQRRDQWLKGGQT